MRICIKDYDNMCNCVNRQKEGSEYNRTTERELVDVEFATIAYDYRIHPDAVKRIEYLLDRLTTVVIPQIYMETDARFPSTLSDNTDLGEEDK